MAITDHDVEQLIVHELEPGERLLWSGRPGRGLRVRPADAFVIPFSVMWAGFFVFWEFRFAWRESLVFRLWGIPFVVFGAYFVVGRFLADLVRRGNTAYGVTDRRVIVISGLIWRHTTSHALALLPAITLSERGHGEGDIVLDASDMNHVAIGGVVSRGQHVPSALEFVPDARHVYEIIRDAHRRAA